MVKFTKSRYLDRGQSSLLAILLSDRKLLLYESCSRSHCESEPTHHAQLENSDQVYVITIATTYLLPVFLPEPLTSPLFGLFWWWLCVWLDVSACDGGWSVFRVTHMHAHILMHTHAHRHKNYAFTISTTSLGCSTQCLLVRATSVGLHLHHGCGHV